jgi:hypothetical protein
MLLQRVLRVYSEPVLAVVKLGEDIAHAQTVSTCSCMFNHIELCQRATRFWSGRNAL